MIYSYKNITTTNQNVILASKNQNTVGVRTFSPGATLELDYPGLTLYVPNILSCTIIGNEHSIKASEPNVIESIINNSVDEEKPLTNLTIEDDLIVTIPDTLIKTAQKPKSTQKLKIKSSKKN